MEIYWMIALMVVGVLSFIGGWLGNKKLAQGKIANAEKMAEKIISEAEKSTDTLKKEKLLEVKDEWIKQKQNFENDTKSRRIEIARMEKELDNRENNMDRKVDLMNQKEKDLSKLDRNLKDKEGKLQQKSTELEGIIREQNTRLEKISGLSEDDAKRILMDNMLNKAKQDSAQMVKEIKDRAKQTANKEAKEFIIQAIQRSAADHSVETTVSVVNLPNDEMKGRIIGREGRNIRAFETATGIEVIVDDTPEAVILSGFDPYRREIARIALERLITDGRIHPARIEEVVEKCAVEMEEKVVEIGEQALMDVGVHGVHAELVKLLGKLNYRTSYGQNVLQHAIEVSNLAGLMAADLELDANLAKRSGILHDIGKAIDKNTEGTHTEIGVEIAKKYKEPEVVLNAIACHHEDVEPTSPISILVQASDAVSGSRPGARRETLEGYVKRLTKLEDLAKSFHGVVKTYAIQAGREVRVMVEHEQINDAMSEQLAADISLKIQDEMEYPGQIKVTVIREYRAIDYAK